MDATNEALKATNDEAEALSASLGKANALIEVRSMELFPLLLKRFLF